MPHIHIINPDTFSLVDPVELFSRDSTRLLAACNAAFHNCLPSGQYKGCYRSHSRPYLKDIRKDSTDKSLFTSYTEAIAKWEATHPEEVSKEEASRKEWEAQRDRQFRIIYGIALRHGFYLDWHGPSCGDQWTVYRHGERLARICCL